MIGTLFPRRPLALSLGDEPAMDEMTPAIRSMPKNWKAVGRDSLPAGLLKADHPEITECFHNMLVNVWRNEREKSSSNRKMQI